MKKRIIIILVLVGVIGWPTVRTAFRDLIIQKALSRPESRQRMSVLPKHVMLSEPITNKQIIVIGYASFDIGTTSLVSRAAAGSDGTCVLVTNTALSVCFMRPFNPGKESALQDDQQLAAAKEEYPKSLRQIRNHGSDPVQAEVEAEDRQPATLWELTWMSKDEFMNYFIQVIQKSRWSIGQNEVICFRTPHAKGLIRIGETRDDRLRAGVWFSSLDLKKYVACHISIARTTECDIGPLVESIARSFRFTVESIPSPEDLSLLIAQAGIPKKEDRQQEANSPGMAEELEKHLQEYQVERIRKGLPPLPVPLTKEMDDQLVKDGVLPPVNAGSNGIIRHKEMEENKEN